VTGDTVVWHVHGTGACDAAVAGGKLGVMGARSCVCSRTFPRPARCRTSNRPTVRSANS